MWGDITRILKDLTICNDPKQYQAPFTFYGVISFIVNYECNKLAILALLITVLVWFYKPWNQKQFGLFTYSVRLPK